VSFRNPMMMMMLTSRHLGLDLVCGGREDSRHLFLGQASSDRGAHLHRQGSADCPLRTEHARTTSATRTPPMSPGNRHPAPPWHRGLLAAGLDHRHQRHERL